MNGTETATPDAPVTPVAPADDAPFSAHIEAFHPETLDTRTEKNAADTDQQRRRHRAAKDIAGPGDVPRIRELTGKVKDAETRAQRFEREAREWREKYEASSRPTPAAPPAAASPVAAPASEPAAFTEKEPTLDDFASSDDPYAAYMRALGKYDRAKERFEERQAQTQAQTQRVQQESHAAEVQKVQAAYQSHVSRMEAYVQQYPDRRPAFESVPDTSGAALFNAALIQDDNSADLLYRLRQQPAVFDEAVLFAYGKPVDEVNVARMQRWLQARVSSGQTGAERPATIQPAPRPPTPVRTTPVPPTDEPPGDSGSLRDHVRAFHKARH